jgi:acyl transferase domain-containing protein/3-hydroxymyristoyl/3-hydroxydecanoyl-(acyl carrier protein) dehydratase
MSRYRPIAIVGLGGIFPGAPTLARFWDMVASGADAAGEPPVGRWALEPDAAFSDHVAAPDQVNSRRGCYIRDFTLDPEGLRIDPELLAQLDPMYHLALYAGRQAVLSARMDGVDRGRVGVVLGNIALPTDSASRLAETTLGQNFAEGVLGGATQSPTVHPLNRYVAGLPGGLLAKALGLGGGAYTLDAACASSLYAVKLACDELAAGRADAMLAGGLSRPDCLYTQMGFSQLRAVSPNGQCSPFDRQGNGLVVGEGAGIFVLKRLEDAERDGDEIHGVIRGAGLSNDVEGNLLAPSSEGQLRAMRAAYNAADWEPKDVDLVECHATGTPVGDSVEFRSLRTLWGDSGWQRGQCVIGSVKSNVGHLLTGAGAAGLMKVLMAFKHKTLPPTAHFSSAPTELGMDESPFQVLAEKKPWEPPAGQNRRAAVSGFGFGGINAHLLIEEYAPAEKIKQDPPTPAEPVAIIGMGAHFGKWTNLKSFQERVLGAGAEHAPTSPQWWGTEQSSWFSKAGLKRDGFKGHFVGEVRLPFGRFRIPPNEMKETLPQQLLMLKAAEEAMRDAGGAPQEADPGLGVFIGVGFDLNTTNFHLRWDLPRRAKAWAKELGLKLTAEEMTEWVESLRTALGPALSANRTMGALGGIVASRVAREFRAGGPSFTLQGEEASGLRAVEGAVRALQRGEIERAIVGAVDLAGDVRAVLGQHATRAYSASGVARPFDADADGAMIGEGAGALVFKRLSDAQRDGDRVYAVLRGCGAAGGGAAEDVVAPADTYSESLRRALKDSGAASESIGLVGAHASGIPEEDAAEAKALADSGLQAVLATTQADIGHAGAASGIAALIKTALCLYQEILPSARGLRSPRSELSSDLELPRQPRYWLRNREEGPRRAVTAAMGVDGTCLHAVLEGVSTETQPQQLQPLGAGSEGLFAIAGESAQELRDGLGKLKSFSAARDGEGMHALARAWYAQQGTAGARAVALVARGARELAELIGEADRALERAPEAPMHDARRRFFYDPQSIQGDVAFVYPGSGNQFPGMGRRLGLRWPEILRRQDRENGWLKKQYLPELFWKEENGAAVHQDTHALIFGQVTLGTLVSDVVAQFGLQPQAVIGYSLGESAGLLALRAWHARDEMMQRMNESTLFTHDLAGPCVAARRTWKLPENIPVDWTLGVIAVPAARVRAALKGRQRVYLLIVNTPNECVIGGQRQDVEELVAHLAGRFIPLKGVTTVHCEVAGPVRDSYRDLHLFRTHPTGGIRFYSGHRGSTYKLTSAAAADSIIENALYGVDYPKTIESAYRDGVRVFLEMGPGSSCTRMIGEILGDRPHVAASACFFEEDAPSSVLRMLARLLAARVPVDLTPLYGDETPSPEQPEAPMGGHDIVLPIGGKPFVVPPRPSRTATPVAQASVSMTPPVVAQGSAAAPTGVIERLAQAQSVQAQTHALFLQLSNDIANTYAQELARQQALLRAAPAAAPVVVPPAPRVWLDRKQCMEIAVGKIGNVLGPDFAAADTHPTRVRLPDEPLMLVDRMIEVEGEPKSMTSGRLVTEHDVLAGAWYLDGGRAPVCISVEAGQADLFLSGYLGIDDITRGQAVYRLLDAVVTFHRGLPQPGETIRYDIRILRFFRQGDTYLFKFEFDGTINGEPVITMREGCAGFFTQAELDAGQGIVHTKLDLRPMPGKRPADWNECVALRRESYCAEQLAALRRGDLVAAFGEAFAGLDLQNPVRLPGGRMTLIDRVLEIEPDGGRFSLGRIKAEADIHADDWFLTCHFVDDQVMPGTLMYECCLHTLRVLLTRMGWVGDAGAVSYEPVPGVQSRLKCRGQVIPTSKKAAYEITLKEIGYQEDGTPYAIADALMYADGRAVVEMIDMSVQLSGLTRTQVEALWQGSALPAAPRPALYTNEQIMAFATGKPSEAFGAPYKVFDQERTIARLPGPPYKFLDRVVEVKGKPFELKAGAECVAEYDVPVDDWTFKSNRHPEMAFAILLEAALQPCGWLAAYCGSALASTEDICFRNLGGSATQHLAVLPTSGTLSTHIKMTSVSNSGGMIIQHYAMRMECQGRLVYEGTTYFGFFTKDALAEQIGIREAPLYLPNAEERARGLSFPVPTEAPFPDAQLRMVDHVELLVSDGGPEGLGFIQGYADVDPSDWFYKAHFYQDPVWPGSLGLESFLQLLKVFAHRRWGGDAPVFENVALGEKHEWVYRGQILPTDRRVTVQACIREIDEAKRLLRADGFLSVDGRVIYQMKDFTLRMK